MKTAEVLSTVSTEVTNKPLEVALLNSLATEEADQEVNQAAPQAPSTEAPLAEKEKMLNASVASVVEIAKEQPYFLYRWNGQEIKYQLLAVHLVGRRGARVLELTLKREGGFSDPILPADTEYTKETLAQALNMELLPSTDSST